MASIVCEPVLHMASAWGPWPQCRLAAQCHWRLPSSAAGQDQPQLQVKNQAADKCERAARKLCCWATPSPTSRC